MSDLPVPAITQLIPDDADLGPAMKALTKRARAFVLALVEIGGSPQSRAAAMAGYSGSKAALEVTGSRLAADARVQEALLEEAKARMKSSSLLATCEVIKVLERPDGVSARDKLAAARLVLEFAGAEPAQQIEVKHEIKLSDKEKVSQVIELAGRIGLDPTKLLGRAGVVLDAEFTPVPSTAGLEDLL